MSETSPATALAPPFPLTDEQRRAVETTGRNVYVTAAAGSGKTAVLTERVFRLIAQPGPDNRPPIPLEQLLIITFTRKAAQEMRERIERRLASALAEVPEAPALRAALDSLPRSNILTIDAFCDRLVRRHFHLVGVSPTVRLADQDEEREIVHLATREVFEASAVGEEGLAPGVFADLLRSTPPSRGGLLESLEDRVDRMRAYVAALEDGAGWMASARNSLEARRDALALEALPALAALDDIFRAEIAEVAVALRGLWNQALSIHADPDSIPNGSIWQKSMERLEEAAAPSLPEPALPFIHRWRRLREWFAEDTTTDVVMKLHTKKIGGAAIYESSLKRQLGSFVNDLKKWRDTWFAHDEHQMLEAERLAAAQGLALLDLAEAVERRVQVIKRRRGLLSFADMQRLALELLTEDGGPSPLALEYRVFFEAVLVDEYQDVSPLQDALIRRVARPAEPESGRVGNLFIVGDVKQSIYRFRQAEPILFRSRLDHGRRPAGDTQPLTLSLSTNFRSRSGVLEHVNELFRGLIDRAIGDVEMDGDALLKPGRPAPSAGETPCVELQWLDPSEITVNESGTDEAETGEEEDNSAADADLRGIEAEARWIAARIRELEHGDETTWIPDDKAPGGLRPFRPSDCAVLVRSLAGTADTWIAELGRWNINVRTAGGESLWNSVEGEDLLAALRLVDQPLDDVALATVLRSPLAGFSDDDLLRLRMNGGPGSFWEAVWATAGRTAADAEDRDDDGDGSVPPEPLDPELRSRLEAFFTRLDAWRELALTHSAETVLDAILRNTGYEAHVLGGPRSEAGARNIDELRVRMRARERHGSHGSGLSDFLHALQAEGGGRQEGEDEALREDPDAIQLMTVHKSKGLEFPVVFLARMGQRYNVDHRSGALFFSPEGSIALAAVDPRRKIRLEPPSLLALHSREARAIRGEELRLLYVAMTRARERLILVASAQGLRHQREEGHSLIELGEPAPAFSRVRATSPAALVGPRVFSLHRRSAPRWLYLHESNVVALPPPPADLALLREALAASDATAARQWREASIQWAESRGEPRPKVMPAAVPPRLAVEETRGTHTPLKVRPSRVYLRPATREESVIRDAEKWSEFALSDEAEMLPVREAAPSPATSRSRFSLDAETEAPDARTRGNLAHALLQHLDLRGELDAAGLKAQAGGLAENGLLPARHPEALNAVPYEGIAAFFASPLGRRLADRPGSVMREMPFTHWMPAAGISQRTHDFDDADPQRLVLVQGVIDYVLDEGDRVTLIDYKSNALRNEADIDRLKQLYALQLQLYAAALRSAWKLPTPPETVLVFLQNGRSEPMNALIEALQADP